jgi:hypothetical protein
LDSSWNGKLPFAADEKRQIDSNEVEDWLVGVKRNGQGSLPALLLTHEKQAL